MNLLTYLPDNIFSHLTSLKILLLQMNKLDLTSKKTFNGMTHLTRLDLSDNLISSLGDSIFKTLPELRILQLHRNKITTVGQKAFSGLGRLEDLVISENNITKLPEKCLSYLPSLVNLYASRNRILTLNKETLIGLFNLKYLDLSHNNLQNLTPDVFVGVESSLEYLSLEHNNMDYLKDAANFSSLSNLNIIFLMGNQVTCSCQLLKMLKSLRSLYDLGADCFFVFHTNDEDAWKNITPFSECYDLVNGSVTINECTNCDEYEHNIHQSVVCSNIPAPTQEIITGCISLSSHQIDNMPWTGEKFGQDKTFGGGLREKNLIAADKEGFAFWKISVIAVIGICFFVFVVIVVVSAIRLNSTTNEQDGNESGNPASGQSIRHDSSL